MLQSEIIADMITGVQCRLSGYTSTDAPSPRTPLAKQTGSHGPSNAHYQQQELLLLVAARVAAVQDGRAGLHRGGAAERRPIDAGGAAAAVAVVPRPPSAPRRRHGVGHAGHRRVPQRDQAGGEVAADRARCTSTLPCDLRRNALRVQQSAVGLAHESQGTAIPGFKVFAGAQPDIDRVTAIWRDCFSAYQGPYLFGACRWPMPCTRRCARVSSPTT